MGKKDKKKARAAKAKAAAAKRPRGGKAAAAKAAPAPGLPGGLALALGATVFTTDIALPGLLHVAVARCPLPRAKVRAVEAAAAQKAPGVQAVRVLREAGGETGRLGEEVVLIAAESRARAQAALGLVRIDFEALPPETPAPAGGAAPAPLTLAPPDEEAFGAALTELEPDAVMGGAAFRLKESYGWERQTLAEWEPHAFVCEPVAEGGLQVWAASEDPGRLAAELMAGLSLPAEKVKVVAAPVGAIFGGRAGLDPVDLACARMALEIKAPLSLVFDRRAELIVGRHRGAAFAEVEVGADKDGHLTAWRSRSWSGAQAPPPLPHLVRPPHRSVRHALVPPEAAPTPHEGAEAAAYFSGCALDELATQMGLSLADVLPLNGSLCEPYGDRFAALVQAVTGDAGWKTRWHPHGDSAEGPVKRGMGLSFGLVADGSGTLAVVVAEVAVDRQTGIVTVQKLHLAGETAREATPEAKKLVEGALSRGAVQGLSRALFEVGDGGAIAGLCEVGRVSTLLVEAEGLGAPVVQVDGPGKLPVLAARYAAPAALANAVANALGLRLPVLPITPDKVLAALAPPAPPPAPAPPAPAPPAAPPAGSTPPPAEPAAGEGVPPASPPQEPPPGATPAGTSSPAAPPPATPPSAVQEPPPEPPPVPPPGWRGRS